MGRPIIDLTGQKFGRLTVVRMDEVRKYGNRVHWLCRCDCGADTSVAASSLTNYNTRSCGCLITHKSSAKLRNLKKQRLQRQDNDRSKDANDDPRRPEKAFAGVQQGLDGIAAAS